MKSRSLLILAVALIACCGLQTKVAHARASDSGKTPVRIHFSSNFEGELEPCG